MISDLIGAAEALVESSLPDMPRFDANTKKHILKPGDLLFTRSTIYNARKIFYDKYCKDKKLKVLLSQKNYDFIQAYLKDTAADAPIDARKAKIISLLGKKISKVLMRDLLIFVKV